MQVEYRLSVQCGRGKEHHAGYEDEYRQCRELSEIPEQVPREERIRRYVKVVDESRHENYDAEDERCERTPMAPRVRVA